MLFEAAAFRRYAIFWGLVRPLSCLTLQSFLTIAFLLSLNSVVLKAQDEPVEDVLRFRTDLVVVPTIVTDNRSRRIPGLTASDFALEADHKAVKVEYFATGTEHVALGFLLDASGSSRDYLVAQREAALALFSRFGPGSEVAVFPFNDRLEIAARFTTDIQAARAGFEFPASSNRRTAIFDSAMEAMHLFDQGRHAVGSERRIIVLTSDGLDTASGAKARDVIQKAQSSGITFYVIHFPLYSPSDGHLAPRPAVKGFRDLAEKTGGRYFVAGNAKSVLEPSATYDLSSIFKAIELDLSSQYLLGFYPDQSLRDGSPHQLEVKLSNSQRNKLRVRTLRGSFSLKQ